MAAKNSEFGIHHVTVVPANFQTDDEDEENGRTKTTDRPAVSC